MIKSFADRATEQLFRERRAGRLPPAIQRVALRKLVQLDAVSEVRHLAITPGNRLEALKHNRAGQHSRINDQWRVCFIWRGHDAYDVEIVD